MNLKSMVPFGRSGLSRSGAEFDPFATMRREMDRLFENFGHGFSSPMAFDTDGFLSPKVDVAETDKGLELTAELPGIDQKDIQLDITDGILTLKAEHHTDKEQKDEAKHYHLVERSHGTFLRRLALPFEPDEDKVEANFNKGVLSVFVPRSAKAETQVKKIAIKGN